MRFRITIGCVPGLTGQQLHTPSALLLGCMMQAGQVRHRCSLTSHATGPKFGPGASRRCPLSGQHVQEGRCIRHIVRAGDDQALSQFARLANKVYLDEAAKRFQEGPQTSDLNCLDHQQANGVYHTHPYVKNMLLMMCSGLKKGQDEDYLIALELGADSLMSLTDLQLEYKDRVKAKLFQRIDELKAEEEVRINKLSKNFSLGKEAYSCGEYAAAAKLLEVAVEEIGTTSQLGGEAQLWLALAYQAMGRESDCIELYKFIESSHPVPRIRRQAADLRYILEAPKLEISEEERVKIPLIQTDTWRAKERKSNFTSTRATPPKPVKTSYWDKARWDVAPPSFIPDKWYVRVAWLALLVGVTLYANFQLTQG